MMTMIQQLLWILAMATTALAQTGFISIDCGLKENSNNTLPSRIVYSPDDGYIDSGVNVDIPKIPNTSIPERYLTMRSFLEGTRNCYTLWPVTEGERYLLRAEFFYGNYDGKDTPPEFDLYLGVNVWDTVKTQSKERVSTEIIALATENTFQVCLVKKGEENPFISVLEVRLVQNSVYMMVNATHSLVLRGDRVDYGGNGAIRYPADPFDRIWLPGDDVKGGTPLTTDKNITTDESGTNTLPQAVLKTAIVSDNLSFSATVNSEDRIIIFLYFAELEILAQNETREFNVLASGSLWYGPYKPIYLTGGTLYTVRTGTVTSSTYTLNSTSNSTKPPLINAREVYALRTIEFSPTNYRDRDAMSKIKEAYGVKRNWQGDPCLPRSMAWDGVGCRYDALQIFRIVSLNLSASSLTGGISMSIIKLTALTSLDLSNNNLTGEIPAELANLLNLKVLKLDNNHLNGTLPPVFHNKSRNGSLNLSIFGNTELCRNNLDLCGLSKDEKEKNKRDKIIPISVGVSVSAVLIIGLIVIIVLIVIARKKRRLMTSKRGVVRGHVENQPGHINSHSHEFSFADIVLITKNFQRMIGRGGFATVYYGSLKDGKEVAVKMLSRSSQGRKDFHAEGKILTRVHHKNLVRLLGYCDDKDNLALVYEYMRKGSLAELLSSNLEDNCQLNWLMRLKIAVDVAQGLDYLHSFCKPPIVHRDIKTRNILLNEYFEAKLGDFGLSRLFSDNDVTHVSTVVAGTPGYLDPEYHDSFRLTEKSDVYSYGIVLLEVITGQPPLRSDPRDGPLLLRVMSHVQRGDIESIVDKKLRKDYDLNSMWKVLEIALKCSSPLSNQRPVMSEVVIRLKECLESVAACEVTGRSLREMSSADVSLISPAAR